VVILLENSSRNWIASSLLAVRNVANWKTRRLRYLNSLACEMPPGPQRQSVLQVSEAVLHRDQVGGAPLMVAISNARRAGIFNSSNVFGVSHQFQDTNEIGIARQRHRVDGHGHVNAAA
jgi:hypothetical protein